MVRWCRCPGRRRRGPWGGTPAALRTRQDRASIVRCEAAPWAASPGGPAATEIIRRQPRSNGEHPWPIPLRKRPRTPPDATSAAENTDTAGTFMTFDIEARKGVWGERLSPPISESDIPASGRSPRTGPRSRRRSTGGRMERSSAISIGSGIPQPREAGLIPSSAASRGHSLAAARRASWPAPSRTASWRPPGAGSRPAHRATCRRGPWRWCAGRGA